MDSKSGRASEDANRRDGPHMPVSSVSAKPWPASKRAVAHPARGQCGCGPRRGDSYNLCRPLKPAAKLFHRRRLTNRLVAVAMARQPADQIQRGQVARLGAHELFASHLRGTLFPIRMAPSLAPTGRALLSSVVMSTTSSGRIPRRH